MAIVTSLTQSVELTPSHGEQPLRSAKNIRTPFQQLPQCPDMNIAFQAPINAPATPSLDVKYPRMQVVPMASTSVDDLELRYGHHSEPIMLTAEDGRLLWSNAAFKQATAEAVMAGAAGTARYARPDLLAYPVMTASLSFYPSDSEAPCNSRLYRFDSKGGLEARYPGLRIIQNSSNLVCPRPLRPIPSGVHLQHLQAVLAPSGPLRGTIESVQHNFEPLSRWSTPVVIADIRGKVRWVNSAYKTLTGQPKCAWMAQTSGQDDRLTGDVSIQGAENLSDEVTALVGTSHISWAENCDSSKCLLSNVPAMGLRLESLGESNVTLGFVWHLDTAAVGVIFGK